MSLRDDLIEAAARALCKKRGYDPDRPIPKTVHKDCRRCEIGEPLWKEHVDDAALVIDTIFDLQKQRTAA